MGQLFALAIESFKPQVLKVGISDIEITDSNWTNLMRKWFVPLEAENTEFNASTGRWSGSTFTGGIVYSASLTTEQQDVVNSNPFLLTFESNKIVAYLLDYLIDAGAIEPTGFIELNPDMQNDGNDMIHRLESSDEGLTWNRTHTNGTVKDSSSNDVLVTPPLFGLLNTAISNKYPAPFLFFRRQDVA